MIQVPNSWAAEAAINKIHYVNIRLPDREKSCTRKNAYRTESFANRLANKIQLKDGKKLRVYKCFYCKQYHLTHILK